MLTDRQVLVTGLGMITPIGNDRATVTASLREGRHGFTPVTYLDNPELAVHLAGTVKGFSIESPSYRDWTWPETVEIPRETLRGLAPHGLYALVAIEQALADAGLTADQIAHDDGTGLFCASAGSAMLMHHYLSEMDRVRGERGNPLALVSTIAGTLNFTLGAHYHITGAVCGFVSACASSSHALGYAIDELKLGRLQRVIVVGAEETNAETALPFLAMKALSPESDPRLASRPFDARRNGFVGAGGAVAMILETADVAKARHATAYAELAGWGQSADGYSVAGSHPEGAGLQKAMHRALRSAQTSAAEVDFVSAHATSTPVGDRAEAVAIRKLFEEVGHPIISGTKGLTGHPLSLSGVMEAAFCCLAIEENFIPGNAHLQQPDEACAGLNLPVETEDAAPSVVLNNSSGFGGSNVCHVLKRV